MEKKKLSTRQLAFSGILAAINIVLIYFSSVSPVLRVSSLVVSSLLTAAVVIETGAVKSLIFYTAVSILSLVLTSFARLSVYEYILLFGIYPVIKLYIEKINKKYLEYIIKILVLVILTTPILLMVKEFMGFVLKDYIAYLPIAYIALCIAFIIYDILLTNMISYYVKNIRNRIVKS